MCTIVSQRLVLLEEEIAIIEREKAEMLNLLWDAWQEDQEELICKCGHSRAHHAYNVVNRPKFLMAWLELSLEYRELTDVQVVRVLEQQFVCFHKYCGCNNFELRPEHWCEY